MTEVVQEAADPGTAEADMLSTEQLLELVATNAYLAWHNTFGRGMSPAQRRYNDRMSTPEPGDLVLEISNWAAPVLNRIGRLISANLEDPPEEQVPRATYDEEKWGRPYPPYLEKVWRIRTLDGREFYWTNARFLVVPENPFRHQASRARPEA